MNIPELLFSLELGIIYGIIAIGIFLTFRVINYSDLTCDGSFVLGAAVSSMALKAGFNPWLSLGMALLSGALAGISTGFLNVYCKVTTILSGILVGYMLYSINLRVMNGMPNLALINEVTVFTNNNPLLVLVCLGALVWLAISYLLVTNFGLALRSTGVNKTLSQNNGVNVNLMTISGLALSNALIALGGALFSQHQGFVDISQGVGTIIVGLAAVMIGEKLFNYRSPWLMVAACLLGSFLYRVIISYALHAEVLGLSTQDLSLITGFLVIAVMIIPFKKQSLC